MAALPWDASSAPIKKIDWLLPPSASDDAPTQVIDLG
jgi:hypothetical protein